MWVATGWFLGGDSIIVDTHLKHQYRREFQEIWVTTGRKQDKRYRTRYFAYLFESWNLRTKLRMTASKNTDTMPVAYCKQARKCLQRPRGKFLYNHTHVYANEMCSACWYHYGTILLQLPTSDYSTTSLPTLVCLEYIA